jgi:hypothetical protein
MQIEHTSFVLIERRPPNDQIKSSIQRIQPRRNRTVPNQNRATALDLEGLYRVSGNKVEVEKLQRLLEVGTISTEGLEGLDKHVIAGAVKKVKKKRRGGGGDSIITIVHGGVWL